MPKFSSSLGSEIAGLPTDDPTRRIDPLRQEQIKQELLRQVQTIPQSTPSISQTIVSYFASSTQLTRLSFVAVTLIIVGGFTTIGAAHAAKPGDLLFNVKLKTHKIQLSLAQSNESKAEIQEEFIEAQFSAHAKAMAKNEFNNKDKSNNHDEYNTKALNNAIEQLTAIELKLQEKGNTVAAERVSGNIAKFNSRVLEIESQHNNRTNVEGNPTPPGSVQGQTASSENNEEKKSEQNSKTNVITDIEAKSSTETNDEAPTENTIKVEAGANSANSTDKLINN